MGGCGERVGGGVGWGGGGGYAGEYPLWFDDSEN